MPDTTEVADDSKDKSVDGNEDVGDEQTENKDISSDLSQEAHESQIEPEVDSPNPDSQSVSDTQVQSEGPPPPE